MIWLIGYKGMLGSMVVDLLKDDYDIELIASIRNISLKLDSKNINYVQLDLQTNVTSQLDTIFLKHPKIDFIINCIGIIKPYCNNENQKARWTAIKVNGEFPYTLAFYINSNCPNTKIINIATDCVYQGRKGRYIESDIHDPEDVYGKTKSLGEVIMDNTLNIRCSIIGPEINNHNSLLDWFLVKPKGSKVFGFTHHSWNGVTTLQFANYCKSIITNNHFTKLRSINHTLHYIINQHINLIICILYSLSNAIKKKAFHVLK